MRVAVIFIIALSSLSIFSQEAPKASGAVPEKSKAVASCGNGHTVDDYLAEKNKLRKARNKNPFPTDTCVFGWCKDTSKLPPPLPPGEVPVPSAPTSSASTSNESSSKPKEEVVCDPYGAAQDVEVGDFYYGDKNYRAALSRYETALQSKPGDPGIFFRLGKTAEKLGDDARAKREYQASIDAAPDGASAKESKNALSRLASKSAK
jgi:tetratricopeptide (TPR) repeat protein